MYPYLWRHLPGGAVARTVQSLLLLVVTVAVLFLWVFPAITPFLPYEDVTVTPVSPVTSTSTIDPTPPPTGATP